MPEYKVLGSKTAEFYIQVHAPGPDEAYDMANEDHVQWFELETDDPIEPHTVELIDEDINSFPTMENQILKKGNK